MSTPPAKEKKAVLDEIDRKLSDLQVAAEERALITQPVVSDRNRSFQHLHEHAPEILGVALFGFG